MQAVVEESENLTREIDNIMEYQYGRSNLS